jgi:site-specific DNA recombinase
MIAAWTAEIQARKAQAVAAARTDSATHRLSERKIEAVLAALANIRTVLERAHPVDKAAVYRQLNLKLIYKPEKFSGQRQG